MRQMGVGMEMGMSAVAAGTDECSYECWADCLKQDLHDFWGFSGWEGRREQTSARMSV